jgi:DedD protein
VATRTTVSDEEIQLRKRARRRLVGAVALVVVVVAAVPMLLDREPKRHDDQIEVRIPPVPPAPAATVTAAAPDLAARPLDAAASAALAAPPASPPAQTSTPAAVERAPEPQPAAPQSAPPPGASAGAAPAQDAAAKPAPHAAAKTGRRDGYVVPLIATSSAAKARELRQKLERQKFPAYVEKTPDGAKTRVRVGPYETKEAAERARQRLVKLAYDPGKVVRRGD